MDLPTAIQVFTGIISIPASIYVFFQIRRDSQAAKLSLEEAREARRTYIHLISSLSDRSDRILLTFNNNNREKPGTFEHLVWGYWKEFEELTRGGIDTNRADWFIYNPAGVLAASQLSPLYYKTMRFAGAGISLMGLSCMLPIAVTNGIGELVGRQTFWHYALSIPLFAILVPLGAILCWVSFRRNQKHLRNSIKAIEVIRQYVTLLESMQIIVQQEFTQLKSARIDSEIAPPDIALKEGTASEAPLQSTHSTT
jgi:hypothetical protein